MDDAATHQILVQREKELASKRPGYQRAKKVLEAESLSVLKEIMFLLRQYQAGDPSDKAVYLIAQLSYATKQISKSINQVLAFEGSEESYQKLRNTLLKETPRGLQEPE